MNNRALYLAVASCFALTGCPDKPEPPKPKAAAATPAAAPKPAGAPVADAKQAQATQKAAPAVIEGSSEKEACRNSRCEVHITVSKCNGADNDIKATPDPIYIAKTNKAKIVWIIDSNDYTFTADGIGWKTAAGRGEFDGKETGSTEYKWKNKDRNPSSYNYWIELQGPGKKTCKKDPTVVNGVVVADPVAPAGISAPQRKPTTPP